MFVSDTLEITRAGGGELFSRQDVANLWISELNKEKHKILVFDFAKTNNQLSWSLHPDGIVLILCFTLGVFLAPSIGRWKSIFGSVLRVAD